MVKKRRGALDPSFYNTELKFLDYFPGRCTRTPF